jgi:hypothetical protein
MEEVLIFHLLKKFVMEGNKQDESNGKQDKSNGKQDCPTCIPLVMV